jgi:hypothetical protein
MFWVEGVRRARYLLGSNVIQPNQIGLPSRTVVVLSSHFVCGVGSDVLSKV